MNEVFLLEGFPASSPRGFLGWANVLLLEDGATRIVIDTGGPGDRGVLIRRMREVGIDPASVEYLILTHLHFDHCLNLDLFPAAAIVMSQAEREYVASGTAARADDVAIPPYILSLLEGRDVILTADEMQVTGGIRVVLTPGHTPGSLSVIYEVDGRPTVMCADLVKHAKEFASGPPTDAGKASLARVFQYARRLIPGHERPFVVEGSLVRYEGTRSLEIQILLPAPGPALTAHWRFD